MPESIRLRGDRGPDFGRPLWSWRWDWGYGRSHRRPCWCAARLGVKRKGVRLAKDGKDATRHFLLSWPARVQISLVRLRGNSVLWLSSFDRRPAATVRT